MTLDRIRCESKCLNCPERIPGPRSVHGRDPLEEGRQGARSHAHTMRRAYPQCITKFAPTESIPPLCLTSHPQFPLRTPHRPAIPRLVFLFRTPNRVGIRRPAFLFRTPPRIGIPHLAFLFRTPPRIGISSLAPQTRNSSSALRPGSKRSAVKLSRTTAPTATDSPSAAQSAALAVAAPPQESEPD